MKKRQYAVEDIITTIIAAILFSGIAVWLSSLIIFS